ncbi:hypothetical protein B0J17DRAFT_632618 [Rhizoctonia solani]|nr:hypothetical protein B0J17DRAFT_632618 [Rhizoctonia solani]
MWESIKAGQALTQVLGFPVELPNNLVSATIDEINEWARFAMCRPDQRYSHSRHALTRYWTYRCLQTLRQNQSVLIHSKLYQRVRSPRKAEAEYEQCINAKWAIWHRTVVRTQILTDAALTKDILKRIPDLRPKRRGNGVRSYPYVTLDILGLGWLSVLAVSKAGFWVPVSEEGRSGIWADE